MTFKNRVKYIAALPMLAVGSAFAESTLPTGVDAALAALKDNATSVATTVLLAVVAVYAIKFIRKGL